MVQVGQAEASEAIRIDPLRLKKPLPGAQGEASGSLQAPQKARLTAYVVHKEPHITIVPDFLSDEEVEHLLQLSADLWVPSTVGTGVYKTNDEAQDLTNKASKNRTSFSCMLRSAHTPTVESVEHRLAHLAGMDGEHLERLNLVRYSPGQFFNRHHDGRFRPKTVFLYLNDLPDDDGGETLFTEVGVKIVPRKGCAVMWSNTLEPGVEDPLTYHLGLPPLRGTKFGVNCFFNDKPLKQWEDVYSDFGDDEGELAEAKPPASDRWHTLDPQQFLEDYVNGGGGGGEEGAKEEGGEGLRLKLKPGQIPAFSVLEDPKILVAPGFLTQTETAALMECTRSPQARAACRDDNEVLLPRVEQRMALIAGLPLTHMDPLRLALCEANMTPDGCVLARDQYCQRFGQKVVFVFLNDVPAGGELRFPKLGLQVKPREGSAVVWSLVNSDCAEDLRASHQCRPPRGRYTRYCALGVFRDHVVRNGAGGGA